MNPLPKADVTSGASTVLFGESINFTSGPPAYVLTQAKRPGAFVFPQQFFMTEAAAPKKSLARHIPPPHSHSFSFFLTKCHKLPPFCSAGQLCTHLASGKFPDRKVLLAGRSVTYAHGHSRWRTIKGSPKGIKQGLFERYSQMPCMLLYAVPFSEEGIKYN